MRMPRPRRMGRKLPDPSNAGPLTALGAAPKSGAVLKNLSHPVQTLKSISTDRGPFKVKG